MDERPEPWTPTAKKSGAPNKTLSREPDWYQTLKNGEPHLTNSREFPEEPRSAKGGSDSPSMPTWNEVDMSDDTLDPDQANETPEVAGSIDFISDCTCSLGGEDETLNFQDPDQVNETPGQARSIDSISDCTCLPGEEDETPTAQDLIDDMGNKLAEPGPSRPRPHRHHHSVQEWEIMKPTIERLYVVEKLPAREVREKLSEDHQFETG